MNAGSSQVVSCWNSSGPSSVLVNRAGKPSIPATPHQEPRMLPAKRVGRTVGILLFVQLVGLTLPFILLLPMTTGDFLEKAAGIALQVRVAVLLLFANGVLTIAIAITAFPVLREHGQRMALWLPAFSVIWFSM